MRILVLIILMVVSIAIMSNNTPTTKIPYNREIITKISPVSKPVVCNKRPIVVAVLDTGFGISTMGLKVKLCKYGHRNFTNGPTTGEYGTPDEVPVDVHGHGTHIAGIIDKFGQKFGINYCLVILKYYDAHENDISNLSSTVKAINYAKNIHADYINYSGGGIAKDDEEVKAVKEYIDGGGKFVAAAGNEGRDIDIFHYYPAQDDPRVIIVGSVDKDGKRVSSSNYGTSVKRTELGKDVRICSDTMCMTMTGTSQATAIATGKMLAQEKNTCN